MHWTRSRWGRVARVVCATLLVWGLAGWGCAADDVASPFVWVAWPDVSPEPGQPRPEHPRPDWRRQAWLNLNGDWEFAFDDAGIGVDAGWARAEVDFPLTIRVPFPWTTSLSGVDRDTGDAGGVGWYRRTVVLPAGFGAAGRRVHLIVGAADWHTRVWVNGEPAGESDNGYLPLRLDVTDLLQTAAAGDAGDPFGGQPQRLTLRVADPGNAADYPHGKQGSPWYAHTAGIWQTVWLEEVAPVSLARLSLTPDLPGQRFQVQVELAAAAPAAATLAASGPPVAACSLQCWARGQGGQPLLEASLTPGEPASLVLPARWLPPWSPAQPHLAELHWRLQCGDLPADELRTTVGLRAVARGQVPGQSYQAVLLNGQPVYLRGVLLQGYWPQSGYTAPDEASLVRDLELARSSGFNLVRLHIKVEEPRLLHHADRLGLLVDADVPCGGIFPLATGDTPAARVRWQRTLEGLIARDAGHPAIVWWTLFNEDWGLLGADGAYDEDRQGWVREMLAHTRQLDPTRLVEDHSTLRFDHLAGTDFDSFHLYGDDPAVFGAELDRWVAGLAPGSGYNFLAGEAKDGAPLVNTEYGPFSFELFGPAWRQDRDVSFDLRRLTGELRRRGPLVGYVLTQLYDVEFEHNGLLNYDRTPKETGWPRGLTEAELHSADFVGFSEPAFRVGPGGDPLTVHPFVSRWGTSPTAGEAETLHWELIDVRERPLAAGQLTLDEPPRAWAVTALPALVVTSPVDFAGPAHLLVEWRQAGGGLLARNVLGGELLPAAPPTSGCAGGRCTVLLDLAACHGDLDRDSGVKVDGEKMSVGLLGAGQLRCPVTLPSAVGARSAVPVQLVAELAANVAGAPQTDGQTPGGEVRVWLDAQPLGVLALPPDRADSRGLLSQLNGAIPRGGYGDLLTTAATSWAPAGREEAELRFEVTGDQAGGLILYGRRLGRWGEAPRLEFVLAEL